MTRAAGSASGVAREFLRLGLLGFGGPTAHLALFRRRFITELGWCDEQDFLDMLGMASLLPGPTSTEMALAIGQRRAGFTGLLAAGLAFIAPAALLVLALAAAYERIGSRPEVAWLLYGIQPVVVAIVAIAVIGLARTALAGMLTWVVATGAFAGLLLGLDPLVIVVAGGLAGLLVQAARALLAVVPSGMSTPTFLGASVVAVGLPAIFLTFLKVGLLSFGSGYVLVAFLHADLVVPGLITNQQLLDGVAIAQVTPGPVYTAATFFGYLLAGVPGATIATVAIFLPAFVGVAIVHPFVPRLRASPVASAVLDGVNAASLGLIAAVTVQLARSTIVDPLTVALAAGSFLALLRWGGAAIGLMVVGGVLGVVAHLV